MPHHVIFEKFQTLFPQYADGTTDWFSNGKNSIRVRLVNHLEFIFSYEDKKNWMFETVDSYLDRNQKKTKRK